MQHVGVKKHSQGLANRVTGLALFGAVFGGISSLLHLALAQRLVLMFGTVPWHHLLWSAAAGALCGAFFLALLAMIGGEKRGLDGIVSGAVGGATELMIGGFIAVRGLSFIVQETGEVFSAEVYWIIALAFASMIAAMWSWAVVGLLGGTHKSWVAIVPWVFLGLLAMGLLSVMTETH